MKIREFLNHKLLQLPKSWRPEYESYYESVIRIGKEYLNLIKSIDEDEIFGQDRYLGNFNKQSLIDGCTEVYRAVVHCIRIYLDEGNPHKSYNAFNDRFSLKNDISNSVQPIFFIETTQIHGYLFRLREKDQVADIGDLFHVPFDKRHRLRSNRYSIPGYPTLYFSNSVFTAYKELGSSGYDNLFASKFEYKPHFNRTEYLLDLRSYQQFYDNPSDLYKYLARWPLIMACNMRVGYPEGPFKPEYVIPQIVLQWVKNNIKIGGRKIIGVSYSSSKVHDYRDEYYGHFYNIAIPVHHSSRKGYCEVLTKIFSLTKPISFNEALKVDVKTTKRGQVKSIDLNGIETEYIKTDFGKIEEVLSRPPYNKMFHVKAIPN